MSKEAMAQCICRRSLHWVFKIGNRKANIEFFRDLLGMKALRHEEFKEGCQAACNGPYDGQWSKTMIGYGPEDNHFVMELTYNYEIGSYRKGDDFQSITIADSEILKRVNGQSVLFSPDQYQFKVVGSEQKTRKNSSDPVQKVTLASSNLERTIEYWNGKLQMPIVEREDGKSVQLAYSEDQARLEFIYNGGKEIDHGKAYGRIAFACPTTQLKPIEAEMKKSNQTILTPYTELDTPGKATVAVVILADPDGYEICFVGSEAFAELSQVDPKANDLLNKAIEEDKSDDWFSKKNRTKPAA